MPLIPDTKIQAVFIPKPANGYAPIFYAANEGSGPMASVNAGNSSGLYVGGGGINLGFEKALHQQDTGEYASRHVELVNQVRAGGANFAVYNDEDPTVFSFLYDQQTTNKVSFYDGICFVDVFGKNLQPHQNPNNTAMLYVAPPKGENYSDETAFLKAIKQTGSHIAICMKEYNTLAATQNVPAIGVIRLCLYSSKIYNSFGVDLNKIALQIYEGLHEALKQDDGGLTAVEFPYSDDLDDPLFKAVKDLLEGK